MDRWSREARSRVMARSKSRGAKSTERRLRALLVRWGIRGWQLGHARVDLGRPDFIFDRARLAIFVDGCFWHGCRKCRTIPKANRSFWLRKIQGNRRRDAAVSRSLRRKRWKVVRAWEHELRKDSHGVVDRVAMAIRSAGTSKVCFINFN
jgi:DNA mismatch endonuclease (patch repair protein)